MKHGHRDILVGLAGQPNSGKSTIFNMLTGARQHVANFPGVTVEKKWGDYRYDDGKIEVVDLPGTYSLTSYTQEERIARDFILLEQPEIVVVVIDASNLERNLYLAFQLREMDIPLVLCLNMMDVARRRGFKIDTQRLSAALDVPVVPTVGKRGKGRAELKRAIVETCERTDHHPAQWRMDYGGGLEPILVRLETQLRSREHLMEDFSARWLAVKLMENDAEARRILLHHTHDETGQQLCNSVDRLRREFVEEHGKSPEKIIAARRYRTAARIMDDCVSRDKADRRTLTDKIDAVVLHRLAGPIILAAVLFGFYEITMGLGTKLANWCFPYTQRLGEPIAGLFTSSDLLRDGIFQSLVTDGIIGGVIAILYYLPIFFVLFALLAIFEDSGYMARIAFILDRLLRGFGLHGQSTLPMLLGGVIVGGCAIPGIMATRAMKDQKARLTTILIMPLMNCMAKIPFYILIVGIFFASHKGLALYSVSVFSFIVALLVAKVFSRHLVRGETAPFVLELPAYHLPTVGGVLRRAIERVWLFLRKILTVVVAVMILVWFFVTFPGIGTKREVQYDLRMVSARDTLVKKLGTDNRYAGALQGNNLIEYLRFQQRYKEEKLAVGDNNSELRRLTRTFESQNREFFLLANRGRDAEGKIDRDAGKAARALRKFAGTVKKLKFKRRKEMVRDSYAGRFGRSLEPVTQLAGFNWRMNIAITSSFAAKENLVGTLGTIYSAEEGRSGEVGKSIRAAETDWTKRHAVAILIFVALFPPCIPTLIMVKSETGSYRWMFFTAVYPIILGFILAAIAFQIGAIFG